MEDMRSLYIKITQIDYFIWLTRVQKIARDKQEPTQTQFVSEYYNQSSCKPARGFDKEKEKLAEMIDSENKSMVAIDTQFCQFIPSSNTENFDKQRQYPLPIF